MSLAGILALAFILVLLAGAIGLVWLARYLTSETDEDRALRFDPFAAPQQQPSPWFLQFFQWWRRRPRQLTYRRDRQGRFRKHRR
jgi:hypothetical protein